ncbi:MAG: UDP-N-acetylmuramoyl-L-alanine--D-glutamate ligase [Gammaproteobacteria bacterium]
MNQLTGKYVVIGLGKTGLSCVRFLKHLGCDVAVIDTRSQPPGLDELKAEFSDVRFLSGTLDQFDLTTAQELIVSPGLSIRMPAIAKAQAAGVSIAGDIELFCRTVSEPVIAVTGSNGKSTVVTLLGELLAAVGIKVKVAGNIGLPVLDALLAKEPVDVWVLELSSFQLETTQSLAAQVACILNVTEDHMDRYDSLNDYASAKQRIFDQCDTAVYWIDDPRTCPVAQNCKRAPFGGSDNNRGRFYVASQAGQSWVMDGNTAIIADTDLLIKGAHNLLNVAAVFTMLDVFGVDYRSVLPALKVFPGLSHRCQWVASANGVAWYNDSKGTNVGAAQAAIEGLGGSIAGKLIWIAGGDGKGADFSVLQPVVKQYVRHTVLLGRDADAIAAVVAPVCSNTTVASLQEAVSVAADIAQPGDVVLLSPACASLDMFKNYEDRGDQFVAAVKAKVSQQ